MKKSSCLLVIGVLAAPMSLSAQDTQWNRYTLEDLDGVHVRFEANDACEAAGVAAAAYEADTSLALIEAEVGVLTREEMLEHLALPELLVRLHCVPGGGTSMAYLVGLRLHQAAQMLRDTQITMPEAVTWYSDRVGVTTRQGAQAAIGQIVSESIAAFAAAWKEANAETEGSR